MITQAAELVKIATELEHDVMVQFYYVCRKGIFIHQVRSSKFPLSILVPQFNKTRMAVKIFI